MASIDTIRAAVQAADLRALTVCLFHWTGDRRWLDDPFRPARDVRLIADPAAGFPAEIQDRIRDAAVELLADGPPDAVVDDPGPELFHEMMNVFLGERVPDEYVPLVRADMGFVDDDVQWRTDRATEIDVAIVGAGISGVRLAAKLDALGIPNTLIDKNADVGGTWFENRYPGCGVDTPNHFYSYADAPNPGWTHYFSPRDELQAYVEACASEWGVRQRARFGTTLRGATWDETTRRWTLDLVDGHGTASEISARVLVAATGHFNRVLDVHFDGEDQFAGDIIHTARWPDGADLRGRRVAVIGTGASAMQLVPTIVPDVESLSVFQRTAQWVRPIPEYNAPVEPASRWLFENLPHYARWYRFGEFWRYGDGLLRHLRRDPDWPHPERSMNRVNDRHRQEMTDFIESELASRPDLVQHCVPDYPPFGKRILIDNGWFRTLCREDVELVTASIERFERDGIRTADGRLHEVDVIVFATGFAITDLAEHIDIRGRDGRRLADDWADENPTAHLGISVPNFPNFFVMYGPNTNMGHGGSGVFLAESQTRYVTSLLVAMVEAGVEAVDCREDRRSDYTAEMDELHEELIWTHPGTSTYYRTSRGKVRSPMPFRLVDYWQRTRRADLADFHLTPAASATG